LHPDERKEMNGMLKLKVRRSSLAGRAAVN